MDKLYESDYVTCINLAWNYAAQSQQTTDELKQEKYRTQCLHYLSLASQIRKHLDRKTLSDMQIQ